MNQLFAGRELVIATMHKKETVIGPLLEEALAVNIVVPVNFNSDQFGTFTREIKRHGDQLETARAKVFAAMEMTGAELGVASEGSFGTHPNIPFLQSNFELLVLIDKKYGYEIKGHHRTSNTNMRGEYVTTPDEALQFAESIGFPSHGVIVRENENSNGRIHKDIVDQEQLIKTVESMLSQALTKKVFIESDMRAHRNPTRMIAIQKATKDLLNNVNSYCPRCKAPGYMVVNFEKGLPCLLCGQSTQLPLKAVYECDHCRHQEKRLVTKYGDFADPSQCNYCNP